MLSIQVKESKIYENLTNFPQGKISTSKKGKIAKRQNAESFRKFLINFELVMATLLLPSACRPELLTAFKANSVEFQEWYQLHVSKFIFFHFLIKFLFQHDIPSET